MKQKSIGRIVTLVSAAIWGTSFPVVAWGLNIIDPFTFVLGRFWISTIVLLPLIFLNEKHRSTFLEYLHDKTIMIMGVMNGIAFLLQFIGQQWTTATKAAIITDSNVIFVAIFSAFLLSERITLKRALGIITALFGIFLIITNGDIYALAGGTILGDITVLSAGIIWSFYIILNKEKTSQNVDITSLMTVIIVWTTITLQLIHIAYAFTNEIIVLDFYYALILIAYTGLFTTIISFFLWLEGLKWLEATTSTVYLLVGPIVAALISVIFLNEVLTLYIILGGILVGLGIYLVEEK
ncbi:MAG: DMT family transporter [Candidatus Odinarchaeota archaeon]|nr:DMT family transporter [Candidatus Odinarchaeota archaeon]